MTVALAPFQLRDAVLTVEEDDFSASVNEVSFLPEPVWEDRPTFAGATVPLYVGTRWSVVLGYAQDVTTPGSLTLYLLAAAGQARTLMFAPRSGGPSWRAQVLVFPGRLGGPTGELLASTTVLPLAGDPVQV